MNRYIVGTVVVFGHPVLICWDNHKGRLDAGPAGTPCRA